MHEFTYRRFVWEGLLQPEECDRLLAHRHKGLVPTGVQSQRAGETRGERSSTGVALGIGRESDWLFARLLPYVHHVNATFGFDIEGYAAPQLLRYGLDQQYTWHVDLGEGDLATRKLSLIVLLSEPGDYEGGDLEWMPDLGPVSPVRGTLVLFPSFVPHRVRPVTRGVRWALVTWVHGGRPYR